MTNPTSEFKKELSVKWIKADSGRTYLCPVESLRHVDGKNEEDLKKICVDESDNPHNE